MNQQPASTCLTLSLATAGIHVTIACDDERLFAALAQHYQAFLSPDAGPVSFEVRASLDPTFQPVPVAMHVAYDRQSGRFGTPTCEGSIDEARAVARLRLAAVQPVADVDYCIRVIFALLAFRQGGLLVHGAGIVHQGRALLFFGHSGSGKTTVTRLSPDCQILNDDLLLLLPRPAGWMAHATPFWNPTQVGPPQPGSAPLLAMFRLVQAQHVVLETLSPGYALAELVSCVPVIAIDGMLSRSLLPTALQIVARVPVLRLHFLPDPSFWSAIEAHMAEQ